MLRTSRATERSRFNARHCDLLRKPFSIRSHKMNFNLIYILELCVRLCLLGDGYCDVSLFDSPSQLVPATQLPYLYVVLALQAHI